MSGGKGGSTIESPDPLAVAGLDFAFNRFNQQTPYSNLNYYAPGQPTPPGQQVGFNPAFLTNSAQQLFAPPPPQGGAMKGAQGGAPGFPQGGALGGQTGGQSSLQDGMTAPFPQIISSSGQADTQPVTSGRATTQQMSSSANRDGGPISQYSNSFKGGQGGQAQPLPPGGINLPTMNGTQNVNFNGLRPATAVQTLSPAMLALENARTSQTANTLAEGLRRQNEVANGALPQLISGLNTSGVGSGQVANANGLPGLPSDPLQFQEGIARTMYNLGSRQMDRTFNRDFETIEQRLANQGLPLGGEAGSRVIGDFFNERNQALGDLASRSVLASGQEASRGLNDITSLRSQGFAEQGQQFGQTEQQRQARLQEQVQNANLAQSSRIAGLNELNTLLGLPQVQAPGIQSFFGSSPTGVTDAFGLNLAGQNAKATLNNQLKGSQLDALTNLGVAGIGAYPFK